MVVILKVFCTLEIPGEFKKKKKDANTQAKLNQNLWWWPQELAF